MLGKLELCCVFQPPPPPPPGDAFRKVVTGTAGTFPMSSLLNRLSEHVKFCVVLCKGIMKALSEWRCQDEFELCLVLE